MIRVGLVFLFLRFFTGVPELFPKSITKMSNSCFSVGICNECCSVSIQVRGTVTDERGDPAIGATVQVQGTTQGTITGMDGSFTLSAPAGGRLQISFMGYHTQIVPVSANVGVIRLVPDVELLEELVVVGFGTGRRLDATTASITRVSGETLQNRPVANVLDGLQGQVAGLQVFTSSGEPSALSTIRLHGMGSLSASSTPLFIVDGMPVEATTIRAMNPNDFESVSVMRDASATSIFGTRAANGVVFITTRRGAVAERGVIRVSGNMGFSRLANTTMFDDMMTADQLRDFRVARQAVVGGAWDQAWADQHRIDNPHCTRWDRVYLRDRMPTNQLDVSFSGGGGRTNYFISAGRTMQEGLAYASKYERMTFRSNINSQVNDWLRVGLNVNVANENWSTGNFFGMAWWEGGLAHLLLPWFTPYDENGNLYDWIPGINFPHPGYRARMEDSPIQAISLATTGFLEIRPIDGLTLRSQVSLDGMDTRDDLIVRPSFRGAPATGGTVRKDVFRRSTIINTNTAEYRFTVQDNHNLTFLAGHEFTTHNWRHIRAQSAGLSDDRLLLLPAGPLNRNVDEASRSHAFLSFFGRAEYDFQERYFVNFSLRNDASSRFGVENRNGVFWSVGTMWHLHRENWMQDAHWLNELTARFSVGTSGNADFAATLWDREFGHLALTGTGQPYDGEVSWNISTPGNAFLTWENQLLYTLSFNFSMLNSRLRGNVELYNRITSAMLVNVPQPRTTGFSAVTQNVGRLANRGVSFRIDGDAFKDNRGTFLTPYVTFNFNQERVLELFDGNDYWLAAGGAIGWIVGQPRVHTRPLWAGVNPQTGSPQWYLPNTDPTTGDRIGDMSAPPHRNPAQVTSTWNPAALNQNTGRPVWPPINGGWGFSAGHRGFHLQTDFTFSIGGYLFLNDAFFTDNWQHGGNMRYIVNDFWREPGDVTRFPRANYHFTQFDDRLVENASFMRLRNVTLGYTVPRNTLDRATNGFLTDARVFVTGRNLLTWTNFTGQDPEVDSNITMGVNPNTRQFSMGFDVTF